MSPEAIGRVHVYTGDGKGKTTAALGLALRSAGTGRRVFFAQFLKAGRTGEIAALERFDDLIAVRQYGSGRFITGEVSAEDVAAARDGLREVREATASGDYDLVILDEANEAVRCGLFPAEALLELIEAKPSRVELVLTGRGADPRLVERADLVTEMREVKHYYRRGVPARDGIER